jgi:two-component system, cell cycle sensor histidine kinase and response regulator CckA
MSAQVLVVEDEKLVAADIQEHLEKLGYGVPGVMSTGEEAIRSASEARPDLVLMDIQLKGRIDGIETARILQTRLNIPVIYVTAFADDRTLQRAKGTEPYGYVLKPFGKKELQTAIELALHKHGRERRLKMNEQWMAALISRIGAGIVAIDHTGLVCMMNPRAEEYTATRLTDALGCEWSDLISFVTNRPGAPECYIRKAVRDKVSSEMTDAVVVFPKTGRKAVICGAVSPMDEPDGGGRAAILVFLDITGWQQLESHNRRARHLEDMRRLAGGLAHQFSNFLTLISGCSESLIGSVEPDDVRSRDIRKIQDVTERASDLTRELLAFSRSQPIHLKALDANQVIGNAIDVAKLMSGSNIAIEQEFDPTAGMIEADPAHVEHIITALLANARDAIPAGGTIRLRTSNLSVDERMASTFGDLSPGLYIRIDVTDGGEVMAYDTSTHIFEPFFSTKDRARDAGLGLAAVYGLVKQNRGHIWFESEPGTGTTFSFCLPKMESAAAQSDDVPHSLRGVETILIADEDAEARVQARDMLLKLGYQVMEAASGVEALKICEQEPQRIDLVLSSVAMPNVTAHHFANRVPEVRPGVKLLFMSPYSEYSLRRRGAVEDGLPIVQMPFTPNMLAKAVRDALATSE